MTYNSSQIFNHQSLSTNCNTQTINTTEQLVSGSEIIYTPYPNTDYVVYEFNFCQSYNGIHSTTNGNYYLQTGSIGGSYDSVTGYQCNFGIYQQYFRDLKNICFIIPAWSGPKKIRLTSDTYASDRTYKIHETWGWGSDESDHRNYNASLEIYSIRNVD